MSTRSTGLLLSPDQRVLGLIAQGCTSLTWGTGGAGVCGLAGLGGGLSVLVDGNLLTIVDFEPALDHGKSSALAGACVAVWVDEEGVWGEVTNVTILPGGRVPLALMIGGLWKALMF